MRISVYLPLFLSALCAAASPLLVRTLPPASAARGLAAGAATLAAASTVSLALLACTLAGYAPFVAEHGHWSSEALEGHDPVPAAVSVLAIAALLLGIAALRGTVLRRTRGVRMARAICRQCHQGGGELLVLADATPRAFAVPGRPGFIVASAGMLQVLDSSERRVLLAHERSHLQHHHHRWQLLADVAAALNPMLCFLRRDVAFALERWADEEAAAVVGDRDLAARSLARAALATFGSPSCAAGLAFERLEVTRRVAALQRAQPPPRPLLACAPILGSGLAAAAVIDAATQLYRLALMAFAGSSA